MRKTVNGFLGQTSTKKAKVKKRIKEEVKKAIPQIKEKIKEQMPSKEELIQRFAQEAQNQAEKELAESQYQTYLNRIGKAKTSVDAASASILSITTTINDIDNYLKIITGILDTIGGMVDLFLSIIDAIGGAINGLPASFASVGLIINLGKLLDMAAEKASGIQALVSKIPDTITYYLNKIVFENEKLQPIRIKILEAQNFIAYHYQILDTVYAKYLENSNVVGDVLEYTGIINEDTLNADTGENLPNNQGDIDNISPPLEGGQLGLATQG